MVTVITTVILKAIDPMTRFDMSGVRAPELGSYTSVVKVRGLQARALQGQGVLLTNMRRCSNEEGESGAHPSTHALQNLYAHTHDTQKHKQTQRQIRVHRHTQKQAGRLI